MNRIQKLSRFFKKIFFIILFGWPLFLAMVWFPDQQGILAKLGISIKEFMPNSSVPILAPISFETKIQGFWQAFC